MSEAAAGGVGAAPADGQGAVAPWKPDSNPWLIAVVVTLAAFMEVLDTTIVNVSLPHIAGSLSSSYDDATWALTSYLVANGIVLTISGWLGDVFGRKRYFMICIAMFTVCSFLCGTSQSLPELIIFRLLQGFFGGGLQPNQQSIILDSFDPRDRGRALALVAVATICGPVIGPTLGGWITDNFTWRWIFFINIPVGAIAFFSVGALVQDPPWAGRKQRGVDYIGLALISIGLGSLELTLDRGQDADWFASPFIRTTAILATVGILGAIGWLLASRRPVVNIRVLGDKNFALGSLMIATLGFFLYSSGVMIPQFAQQVIGYTATLAGLILSPGSVVVIVLLQVTTRLLPKVQTRYIIAFGFCLISIGFAVCSGVVSTIDFGTLVWMRTIQIAGIAFLFVPMSIIAYTTIPRELNKDAAALYTMFRNVAGSIGIALTTSQIEQRTQVHEAYLAYWASTLNAPFNTLVAARERVLGMMGRFGDVAHNQAMGNILQEFRTQAAVLAYRDVFIYGAVMSLAVVPFTFLFAPTKAASRGGPPAH